MNNTHVIFCAILSTVASGCATTLAHGAEPAPKGGVEVTMGPNTAVVSDGVTNPDVCENRPVTEPCEPNEVRFDSFAPSLVANFRVGVGGCADIGLTASLLGATAESTLCVINSDGFILSVNPEVGLVNYEIGELAPYYGNVWHSTLGALADVRLGKTTLSFGARGGAAFIDEDIEPLVGLHTLATWWLTDQVGIRPEVTVVGVLSTNTVLSITPFLGLTIRSSGR